MQTTVWVCTMVQTLPLAPTSGSAVRPVEAVRSVARWWYQSDDEPAEADVAAVAAWAQTHKDDHEAAFLAWMAVSGDLASRDVNAAEVKARFEQASDAGYAPAVAMQAYQLTKSGGERLRLRMETALVKLRLRQPVPEARFAMGMLCLERPSATAADVREAESEFRAAAEGGFVRCWSFVALAQLRQQRHADAIVSLRRGAEAGDPQAQARLAEWLLSGPAAEDAQAQAATLLAAASRRRNTPADFLFQFARILEEGRGTKADDRQALTLYERAGAKGHQEAQLRVAIAYLYGIGTEPRPKDALALLESLARDGCAEADYQLGRQFLEGLHVPRDPAAAREHFRRAASRQHPTASRHIDWLGDPP